MPTPQIGGVVIVPIYLVFTLAFSGLSLSFGWGELAFIYAPLGLVIIGFIDDRYGLSVFLRLPLFILIVGSTFLFAPELQKYLLTHHWLIVFFIGFATLSFMNFTNFMDGMDGMLVNGFTPALSLLIILSSLGYVKSYELIVPVVLLAVLLGFACFNRPPAKIFMGDAGSISLGFLVAILLVHVALEQNPVSALLPVLYFITDASLTLTKRIFRCEKIWQAHRQHAYQRAMDRGQSVPSILIRIALVNVILCILSYLAINASLSMLVLITFVGGVVVFCLFLSLERNRGVL